MRKGSTISRPWFCSKCYEAWRPVKDDYFVVYGSTGKQLYAYRFDGHRSAKLRGITPHLIKVDMITRDSAHLMVTCGIHGCGVNISPNEKGDGFLIHNLESRPHALWIADWRKLLNLKWIEFHLG